MNSCRICLKPTTDSPAFHPACLQSLFEVPWAPRLEFTLPAIMRIATDMAGKMSFSGVQEKVSLRLSDDSRRLEMASIEGRYILKPEPSRFAFVPQNEHVTMRLASDFGIEVPPLGLFELQDGSIAYLIKRFDRLDDGTKLLVEDFCQLSAKPPGEKYNGSSELCVRVLRQFASNPDPEIVKLFRLLVFSWWVSNGDQHLKNFSVLTDVAGLKCLSPAYDLLCTRLPIPSDRSLALTVCGRKSGLTRETWLQFADYCQIARPEADAVLNAPTALLDESLELIQRAYLPDDLKVEYAEILRANAASLDADR